MKLEPTEAQRKAMAEATEAWNWYSCGPERRLDMVDDMIAAANSIPEGAPVGTIARRPDGAWIAFVEPAQPGVWLYRQLLAAGQGFPEGRDADSWPVIFTPGEAVGSGPTTDGGETYDPREPSREELRAYFHQDLAEHCQADDPDEEPATTHSVSPESTNCVPKPRTPRVVDRLGVDEQGSRWRGRGGTEYWFNGHGWCDSAGSDGKYEYPQGYEPNMASPYTEVLPDVG